MWEMSSVNTKDVEHDLIIITKERQNPYIVQYLRKIEWLMWNIKSLNKKNVERSLFIITKE